MNYKLQAGLPQISSESISKLEASMSNVRDTVTSELSTGSIIGLTEVLIHLVLIQLNLSRFPVRPLEKRSIT